VRHDRRIERSRATRQEFQFIHAFNQQLGDFVPARICLSVFQPRMFLRKTLNFNNNGQHGLGELGFGNESQFAGPLGIG